MRWSIGLGFAALVALFVVGLVALFVVGLVALFVAAPALTSLGLLIAALMLGLRAKTRALLVLPLLLVVGACGSMPADRIVYNSIGSATSAVEGYIAKFNADYTAGKRTNEDRRKLLAAIDKYQAAATTATHLAEAAANPQDQGALILINEAVRDFLAIYDAFKAKPSAELREPEMLLVLPPAWGL